MATETLPDAEKTARDYLGDVSALQPVGRGDLADLIARGEVVVVDVRPAEEYAAGHIAGALSIPHDQLAARLPELPKESLIVAYCCGRFCVMAPEAVRLLRANGFDARLLADGWPQWHAEGLRGRLMRSPGLRDDVVCLDHNATTVAELASIAHEHGALFHTGAAQAVGKIPVSVSDLGVDLLTVARHKFYAPKAVGALYVRHGVTLEPLIPGGGQEEGRRSGTENVAFAVALGEAARLAGEGLTVEAARIGRLRDRLFDRLDAGWPGGVRLNGHPDHRLPGTLNVSLPGIVARDLLAGLPGLAAATGSACHTGDPEPSAVLTAMGLDRDRALSAIRFSLGRWTTEAEIDRVSEIFAHVV